MKKAPEGWSRITSALFYEDAAAAIDWLVRVIGFEVRLKVEGEGGIIVHSELTFAGEGPIGVSTAGRQPEGRKPYPAKSPRALGGANTQMLCIYLDDVDGHYARVRAAGAKIVDEPATNDYGEDYWTDRSYRVEDPEGHHWWFVERMRG